MALKTQDGVNKILLSGLRATVIMADGSALDEDKVSKALQSKNLGLVSFAKTEAVIPEAAYVLRVSGTG